MIRLVYISPKSEDDALRIRTHEARSRDVNDYSLVADGFLLSLRFDGNDIEAVLRKHKFTPMKPLTTSVVRILNTEPKRVYVELAAPVRSLDVHFLGVYQDDDVYAVVAGTCYAEFPHKYVKGSVSYHLATIDQCIKRCADADFYNNFLKEAVLKL